VAISTRSIGKSNYHAITVPDTIISEMKNRIKPKKKENDAI